MTADDAAPPTLHTRVESWECDFNGHWNARYYGRSFQMACENVAAAASGQNPGLAAIAVRHIRFHRELHVGAAVELRSARIADGEHAGAVVHWLSSEGRLSATALDFPGLGGERLPAASSESAAVAFPRGLPASARLSEDASAATAYQAETGPVRPMELDHGGALLFEDVIRRVALSSHGQLARLGFTGAFVKDSGVNRMVVETRVTPQGRCAPGKPLRVRSRLTAVAEKSFATRHRLETAEGETIALVEHTLVAVDLKSRRAVEVPAFLRDLGGAGGEDARTPSNEES